MEIKKCENCGSEHIHVITKEIGYSCLKCGRNTVRLNEMHQTNADRIRSMSDEELAEFLCKVKSDYQWADHEFPSDEECGEWVEWLQTEVEE